MSPSCIEEDESTVGTSSKPTSQTLLPTPVANLVSLATASSAFSLRLGGAIGHTIINAARIGTLLGLETSRTALYRLLARAEANVATNAGTSAGETTVESLLTIAVSTSHRRDFKELKFTRSVGQLDSLHYAATHSSLLVSAGFQIGTTSLASSLALSQTALGAIDAILGDTATSKAIATIIVLVQREFEIPETGVNGERVTLVDLLVGAIGFTLLQRWTAQKAAQLSLEDGTLVPVWDIVVLDNSRCTNKNDDNSGTIPPEDTWMSRDYKPSDPDAPTSWISSYADDLLLSANPTNNTTSIRSSPRLQSKTTGNEPEKSDLMLHGQISEQVAPGTSVQVVSSQSMTDTVTVEIDDDRVTKLEPPAGYNLIAVHRVAQSFERKRQFIFQSKRSKARHGSFKVMEQLQDRCIHPLTETLPAHTSNGSSTISLVGQDSIGKICETMPFSEQNPTHESSTLVVSYSPVLATQKRQRLSPVRRSHSPEANNTLNHKCNSKSGQHYSKTDETNVYEHKISNSNTSVKTLVSFWSGDCIGQTQTREDGENDKQSLNGMEPKSGRRQDCATLLITNNSHEEKSPCADDRAHGRRRASLPCGSLGWPDSPDNPSGSIVNGREVIHSDARPEIEQEQSRFRNMPVSSIQQNDLSNERHRLQRSPRVYSVATNVSEGSLTPHRTRHEAERADLISQALLRSGKTPHTFPSRPFAIVLARFAKFSIASYGETFLRLMGNMSNNGSHIQDFEAAAIAQHKSFSMYTTLPTSTVILSSYVDPHGGASLAEERENGMPLVYYVSVDHEFKAVVLSCRGTLGLEDVLTDMTCDYDDIDWNGKRYMVHKGMHASARRLLTNNSGRILVSIKNALEEFPDYGLVICGHSLGGAVAAILAIMLAVPQKSVTGQMVGFVTSTSSDRMLGLANSEHRSVKLPAGRSIHAYAYGPAASVSPALQRATRGLVTTVVHGRDIVPSLSLGTLHDFQAIALAFKTDAKDAKGEVKRRVWDSLSKSLRECTGLGVLHGLFGKDDWLDDHFINDDHWPWAALKSLRASMLASKLVPPGEVFLIDASPAPRRCAFVDRTTADTTSSRTEPAAKQSAPTDKAATRIKMVHVQDVERHFNEVRFTPSMFADHFPARYESVLEILQKGVSVTDVHMDNTVECHEYDSHDGKETTSPEICQ